MKIRHVCLSLATVLLFLPVAFGQGFLNLDFEQATIAPTPVGGWTYPADPSQCFPGWTVGDGVVMYNDLSLGSPATVLMGPDFPNFVNYTPLQGSYSVLLQYFGYAGSPASLSQTALVPSSARSVSLLGGSGAVITMNGVNIPLLSESGGRVAGDISAYAGTVAQLTISTLNSEDWVYFDDIQFSPSSVPEPDSFSLVAIGAIFSIWLTKRPNTALEPTPTAP